MRGLSDYLLTDRDLYLSLLQKQTKGPGLSLAVSATLIIILRVNHGLLKFLNPPT